MTEHDEIPASAILGQIFRDAPVPLAIYDLSGELTHRNEAHEAFADALGDAAGIGKFNALYDLRSKRGGHCEHFRHAMAGAVSDYAFSVQLSQDSEVLNFRRMLMPAYDTQRRPLGVVSVIVDVSEWLQAELDKSRLQVALQQAQKSEALGLLAGGIAHDFNNLLVGVLGNASLLLDALDESSPLRRFAQSIELAAQRAAEVARQLLAYAGKGQFRIEHLDLSELAQETSELLRITISPQANLVLQLAANLAKVNADATQMRQVVMNLITNARDAVGQSGTITLRTGELSANEVDPTDYLDFPDSDATRFVFLEVEDTGHGMSGATVARIFDPFFTTKPSGRGLGLSAVLGIVRSQRGAMSVRSTEGRGTAMRVLLPAVDQPFQRAKLRVATDVQRRGHALGHVLVVDDQAAVRAMVGQLLQRLGYSVTQAATGDETVCALEGEAAAACCVLLDLSMPGEDGGQIARRISERYPQLPIIFMSGYEAQSVPVADAFLHKPFTLHELQTVLDSVISEERRSRGPQPGESSRRS